LKPFSYYKVLKEDFQGVQQIKSYFEVKNHLLRFFNFYRFFS